jgi:hypothetical protein
MACPICTRRKPRRACPARGDTICAVCCGTKRLVEIACPSDCVYLQSAERHPAAVVKRQHEQDLAILLSAAGRLSEPQLHVFFLVSAFIARFTPSGLAQLIDADVADAAGAVAATLETATRGVIYEHQSSSPVAEGLRRAIQAYLSELGKDGGSRFEREAVDVLRGIERGARHDVPGLPPGERAYLEAMGRILRDRGSAPAPPATSEGRPSIILP